MVALLEGKTLINEKLRLREEKRYFKFNIIWNVAGQLINGLKLFAL